MVPRSLIRWVTSSRSWVSSSAIGRWPISGNTWVRNLLSTVLACPSVQRRDISTCHSKATVSNRRLARWAAILAFCFSSIGSRLSSNRALASSRLVLATANETMGYLPMISVPSLPLGLKYRSRQVFEPQGVTYRYMPPPSNSL
ncbi:hypothetical protein D3C76_1463210 [compost metagenome]